MPRFPLDLLNLFVAAPGDSLYFLLVIGLSLASLFLAIGQRSRFPLEHSTGRYLLATSAVAAVWSLVMAVALIALLSELERDIIMPPLERLAHMLTLLVLAWALLSADSTRWSGGGSALLVIAIIFAVLAFVLSMREWGLSYEAGGRFNASGMALLWSGFASAIGLLGLLIAFMRIIAVVDAPLKCLLFLLIMLGNGWDALQLSQANVAAGNYLGGARMAYLGALVFVPIILYRLTVALLERKVDADSADVAADEKTSEPTLGQVMPGVDDGRIVEALANMLGPGEESGIPERITGAVMTALGAEGCLLLRVADRSRAEVIAGLGRLSGGSLSWIPLDLGAYATLKEAVSQRRQIALERGGHAEEVDTLLRGLSAERAANIVVQPITRGDDVLALLIVAVPDMAEFSSYRKGALELIGAVAGYQLALGFAADMAPEQTKRPIRGVEDSLSISADEYVRQRREMEASLAGTAEELSKTQIEIRALQAELHDERQRVFGGLEGGEDEVDAQEAMALFDEHSQLRERRNQQERDLLDAEIVLRVCGADTDDDLAQIIREHAQKTCSAQHNARDRLRRQVMQAQSHDTLGLMESLREESRQLETESEHLQKRLDALHSRLSLKDIDPALGGMAQALIQLYAERKSWMRLAEAINHERHLLLQGQSDASDEGGGDSEALRGQLKRLHEEHQELLNLREEMRRDYQSLLARYESRGKTQGELETQLGALRQRIDEGEGEQDELRRRVAELCDERDNLLLLRDQLKAKIAESHNEAYVGADEQKSPTQDSEQTEGRGSLPLEMDAGQEASDGAEAAEAALRDDAVRVDDSWPQGNQDGIVGIMRELQGPMAAIAECTDILLAESVGILGAAQKAALQRVSANLESLAEMLDGLLMAASEGVDRFALAYSEVDVGELLDEAISVNAQIIQDKKLVMEIEIEDGLPRVAVDAPCIQEIFVQLLGNACQVSADGERVLVKVGMGRIDGESSQRGVDAIHISVCDQGGGISPFDSARVFARRYKSANPKIAGFSGIGVGMAVARAYARAHGGDLWIDSLPGAGSIFQLALPTRMMRSIEE